MSDPEKRHARATESPPCPKCGALLILKVQSDVQGEHACIESMLFCADCGWSSLKSYMTILRWNDQGGEE